MSLKKGDSLVSEMAVSTGDQDEMHQPGLLFDSDVLCSPCCDLLPDWVEIEIIPRVDNAVEKTDLSV